MQAYKCDLCTAFFTKQNCVASLGKGNHYSVVVKENGRAIDICPDCAKAIQKAIDECCEMGVTRDGTKNS